MLTVARELLSERGYDGVTMRLLAKKSGVAPKTLYDVYGSKENILIESVKDRVRMVYEDSEAKTGDRRGVALLFHFVDSGTKATETTPTSSKAVAPFVAEPSDHFGLAAIHRRCHGRALEDIAEDGELEPWASPDALLAQVSRAVSGTMLLWAYEYIPRDYLGTATRLAVAQALLPAVRGQAQREAMALIRAIYSRSATTRSRRQRVISR